MRASHLLHVLLVEDLLHGQELDDAAGALEEGAALVLGVLGVAEGDEEAALAAAVALALHDGLEGVDVGAADLVDLLDLDGEASRRRTGRRRWAWCRRGRCGRPRPCRRPAPCSGCRRGRSPRVRPLPNC